MRRAHDRARSARSRKNEARSTTIEYHGARSATNKSRALGALKLAREASCAWSARWECAREAGRFFSNNSIHFTIQMEIIICNLAYSKLEILINVSYWKKVRSFRNYHAFPNSLVIFDKYFSPSTTLLFPISEVKISIAEIVRTIF